MSDNIPCGAQLKAGPCAGTKGHPGDCSFYAEDIPVDDAPECGAKPNLYSASVCRRPPGHIGRHSDPVQGHTWPQSLPECGAPNSNGHLRCQLQTGHPGTGHHAVDFNGVSCRWYEPGNLASPLNAFVLATVSLHAARSRLALADVVASLEGLRLSTTQSRALRAKRNRLGAEVDAWNMLEDFAKGVRP